MKRYRRVYLEIANVCNLSCSFCPITERDKNYMSLEDFEKALREVAPLADQVCLHLMGEPLAHPEFVEILRICEEYNTQIQITTNGLLLKSLADEIIKTNCIRQINISVQAYMDNFPQKNINQYLDQIFESIDLFFIQKPELYLNLRLWNIEGEDFHINEPIFLYVENKLNLKINRNIELGRIKSKKLINKLYLHFDSRFEWPRSDRPFQNKNGRCNGLLDHFAIHADGTVVPCCLDDQKIINLGNLFDQSLNSILESDRAMKIADGFKNNQLIEDLCQKCTYINRFNR